MIADDILSYLLGPSYAPPVLRSAYTEPSKKLADAGTAFIGVHLRQGDFIQMARAGHPLSAYATSVDVLQARLALLLHPSKHHFNFGTRKKGGQLPVLFTTDSKEPDFIASLTKLGWIFIDHDKLKTVKKFGGWYPAIIDSLILSRGVGFVGSSFRSSLPTLADDMTSQERSRVHSRTWQHVESNPGPADYQRSWEMHRTPLSFPRHITRIREKVETAEREQQVVIS